MKTYAIVKNGLVENIIEYKDQPTTPPPGFDDGYVAIQADSVSPGWLYENGKFIDTTPPAEAIIFPPSPTIIEQILASPSDLAALKKALGL